MPIDKLSFRPPLSWVVEDISNVYKDHTRHFKSYSLKDFFELKRNADVIIIAGEEPNQKEFLAHSNILRKASSYFEVALSETWAKRENNKYIIKKDNISPDVLSFILEKILEILNASDELLILSDMIDILKEQIFTLVWIEDNFDIALLILSFGWFENTFLHCYCLNEITFYPELFFESNLLSFVRYKEITLKQYKKYILPYKDILPEEIKLYFDNYNDIYYYYLIKVRNPLIDRDNFNSNLINIEQAFYLQKDIFNIDNNLNTFLNDNNRAIIEFKLLLRGSTNGFASKNFHKLCDKKKQIIVVIKIKENKQIIGGYNSVGKTRIQNINI
nr:14818_t:CDS:2 [Entrophospora candida]